MQREENETLQDFLARKRAEDDASKVAAYLFTFIAVGSVAVMSWLRYYG